MIKCPKCNASDVDRLYYDQDGDVFGCDCCVREVDADEVEAEQEDEAYWDEIDRIQESRRDAELEREYENNK